MECQNPLNVFGQNHEILNFFGKPLQFFAELVIMGKTDSCIFGILLPIQPDEQKLAKDRTYLRFAFFQILKF